MYAFVSHHSHFPVVEGSEEVQKEGRFRRGLDFWTLEFIFSTCRGIHEQRRERVTDWLQGAALGVYDNHIHHSNLITDVLNHTLLLGLLPQLLGARQLWGVEARAR